VTPKRRVGHDAVPSCRVLMSFRTASKVSWSRSIRVMTVANSVVKTAMLASIRARAASTGSGLVRRSSEPHWLRVLLRITLGWDFYGRFVRRPVLDWDRPRPRNGIRHLQQHDFLRVCRAVYLMADLTRTACMGPPPSWAVELVPNPSVEGKNKHGPQWTEREEPMPRQSFEDALDALLLRYRDEDPEDIISVLELKLDALREDPTDAMGQGAAVDEDEDED
jgi:hypothetical protein